VIGETVRCLLPACILLIGASAGNALVAQGPAVAQERAEYERWLGSAVVSPYEAIAQVRIGSGIRLGPRDADVPLDGIAPQQVSEQDGRVVLQGGGAGRSLPRGRAVSLAGYTLVASGPAGRASLSIFGKRAPRSPPVYFPYDSSFAFTVTLERAGESGQKFVLAVDGTEVEAPVAGTVAFTVGGTLTRLLVRRIPGDNEESDLEVYFRDGSNGKETYPAGRFVTLLPLPGGRYLLDFNRARNPFCAYNSVYACPAPWRGNSVLAPLRAGERYSGGGLETPPVADSSERFQ
jgi:uncharacterized protein